MSMPALIVEVAFGSDADTGDLLQLDDPTRGKLDAGKLAAGAGLPVWTDLTPWVRTGNVKRGSNRVDSPIIQYDAGTCSITLDNSDRRFDPSNVDGPYVDAGATLVTAMRAVRVRAVWDGTYYEVFRGFVDQWAIEWTGPNYAECVMTASDAFKIFTNISRPAVALPVGAGEDTGARIHRILDSVDWPAPDRSIATGDSTLQGTTLEGGALEEMHTAANSELGELYVEAGGRVAFRNRLAVVLESRSNTSLATFGDGGGSELPYQTLEIASDDATFYNEVRVTSAGGTEQFVQDTSSQALYYRKTFSPGTELVLQTDTETLSYAQWLLYVSRAPEVRFTAIGINPRYAPGDLFPHVLGRLLGDRITVVRRPPGGGSPAQADVFIRGIEHTFSPADWQTTWSLQSADRYAQFLTLDHPQLGRLDHNAPAY